MGNFTGKEGKDLDDGSMPGFAPDTKSGAGYTGGPSSYYHVPAPNGSDVRRETMETEGFGEAESGEEVDKIELPLNRSLVIIS